MAVAALFFAVAVPVLTGGGAGAASSKPVNGGTLTFAAMTLTPTLDPAKLLGGGTVGSIELQSIYGTLVTWNGSKYVPMMAQSLTSSQGDSVWTLKLKPGLKFTDGTAFDASAVQSQIQRMMAPTSTAADKALLNGFIQTMTVVDPQTLVFNLNQAWAGFPFLLSDSPGEIASPTQVQKLGSSFSTTVSPAGAGPFMVQSYQPGVALTVVANPNYTAGPKPHLAEIKFVQPPTDPTVTEADVKTGTFDGAYSAAVQATAQAEQDGLSVIHVQNWSGTSLAMNDASGPTANLTVRQAIAAAINVKTINQRVYSGDLQASTDYVGPKSAWNPHLPGPQYNLTKAKSLLKQAEAATGYNGDISLLTGNDPVAANLGVTLKAELDAAGFNTTVTDAPTNTLVAQILVSKTFQLASWGLAYDDSDIFFRMYQSFSTVSNRYGFTSPAMDAALNQLRTAATPAKEKAAVAAMAKIYNSQVPWLNFSYGGRDIMLAKNVHGVQTTSNQCIIFGGAWVS
jgi:peptide/nickel transport system substrate-binding protein